MDAGYQQRQDLRRFQLVRQVRAADGGPIDVIVDFLMPRDAEIVKNVPPLISEFAVQRASGADLARCDSIRWCHRRAHARRRSQPRRDRRRFDPGAPGHAFGQVDAWLRALCLRA